MANTSSVSQAILDAENKAANWANGAADTAADLINFQGAIVSPRLSLEAQIGDSFFFDYCGDVRGELDTDITDHYAESTVFIQDHAILKPRMITLRGFIGEIVARPPKGVVGLLNSLTGNLTVVSGYLGKYGAGTISAMQKATAQAQNVVSKINSIAAKGNNILNILGGNVAKSKQAQEWARLETMWAARIPMTVTTPTKIYNNMLVKNVVWINPESTKYWSEVIVTMKEIRTTGTIAYKVQGDTITQQTSPLRTTGQTAGTTVPTAGLKGMSGSSRAW